MRPPSARSGVCATTVMIAAPIPNPAAAFVRATTAMKKKARIGLIL
jgi:hypothetical protein